MVGGRGPGFRVGMGDVSGGLGRFVLLPSSLCFDFLTRVEGLGRCHFPIRLVPSKRLQSHGCATERNMRTTTSPLERGQEAGLSMFTSPLTLLHEPSNVRRRVRACAPPCCSSEFEVYVELGRPSPGLNNARMVARSKKGISMTANFRLPYSIVLKSFSHSRYVCPPGNLGRRTSPFHPTQL